MANRNRKRATKKESREVGAFTSLASGGPMEVKLSYGNSNSISVEADENLLPYIETTVSDGKLTIKTSKNKNLKPKSKMTVYVSMTTISSLQLSGSGSINGDGNFTNDGKRISAFQVPAILILHSALLKICNCPYQAAAIWC